MAKLKDLMGQKFGKLTVIGRAENDSQGRAMWICKCDCGNPEYKIVRSQHLIRGSVLSCGCLQREREDLTGQKFGMLTVISMAEDRIKSNGNNVSRCKCKCDCGNETIVDASALKSKHTQSCGCLQGEHHNDSRHDIGKTRLYRIWGDMKQRCYNPNNDNFKHYGARGIEICSEWKDSYSSFKEWAINNGYADNLSIDRIDTNGNYEPQNCRWSTEEDQANNTRTNRLISFNGETLTLSQWRKRLGFKRGVLEYRLNHGWDLEKAFYTPVG
jgi:hypothetical protein